MKKMIKIIEFIGLLIQIYGAAACVLTAVNVARWDVRYTRLWLITAGVLFSYTAWQLWGLM